MEIRRCVPAVLTAMVLMLTGCDAAPVAPEAGPRDTVSQSADQAPAAPQAAGRSQCVNNLKQIGLGLSGPPTLHIIAPSQTVVDGDGRELRFRADLHVWDVEDAACGQARLEPTEGHGGVAPAAPIGVLVLVFSRATVREANGLTEVAFEGEAEVCREREGDCETVPMTGEVRERNDDEPIWQFHVGGVYSGDFSARTRFVFPGPGR